MKRIAHYIPSNEPALIKLCSSGVFWGKIYNQTFRVKDDKLIQVVDNGKKGRND